MEKIEKENKSNYLISVNTKFIRDILEDNDDGEPDKKLNQDDLAIYMTLAANSFGVEDYEELKLLIGFKGNLRISVLPTIFTERKLPLDAVRDILFGNNRNNNKKRKQLILSSIAKMIDKKIILCSCWNKERMINHVVYNGRYFLQLYENEEVNELTLYVTMNEDEKFVIVPKRKFVKMIDVCKNKKGLRDSSVGYYVLLLATIYSHMYYKVENGTLKMAITECYLLPEETYVFTKKRRLWECVDDILSQIGVHHVYKKLMLPANGAYITNQYFGVGSMIELEAFVKEKIANIRAKEFIEAPVSVVEKQKVVSIPKTKVEQTMNTESINTEPESIIPLERREELLRELEETKDDRPLPQSILMCSANALSEEEKEERELWGW